MVFADMTNLITLTVAAILAGLENFAKTQIHATLILVKGMVHVESAVIMLTNVHVLSEEPVSTASLLMHVPLKRLLVKMVELVYKLMKINLNVAVQVSGQELNVK